MRRHWWQGPIGRAVCAFGATLGALVFAGGVGMRAVPALRFAHQELAVQRRNASWYSVFFRGGTQLDHTILWNGIGPSMANARQADIIFLGTSQVQFAVPDHEIRAFERRTGLRVFTMGLPFGEPYGFPLAMIEKFDLRPRIVVANVPGFFRQVESPNGRAIRDAGFWNGLTTVWEERLAARVWPVMSRILPTFATKRPRQSLLRSSRDGAWLPVDWPHAHIPVSTPSKPHPVEVDRAAVRRFRTALAMRAITPVFVCVPSAFRSPCDQATKETFGPALFVTPHADQPLWTGDLVHLCPLSGKLFGRALFRDLAKLDVVRALARSRPGAQGAASAAGSRGSP